jgi:AcrR family transcriptional regulator
VETSSRRSYHHGDLRAELVRVAVEMLDRDGPATLSLRDAARRAGVSHGAPYRHFADREALLAEVVAKGYAQLGAALQAASAAGGAEVARAYLRFALEHPRRYELMFRGDPTSLARREAPSDQAQVVLRLLTESIPGVGDADYARRAGIAAWSLLHGLAVLQLNGYLGPVGADGDDADRLAREVVSMVRFAAKPAAAA